jgi:hypothetical protein
MLRFLQLLVLAVPAYMIAVAAGIFFCRHNGWPDNYDLLDAGQKAIVGPIEFFGWAIALFLLDTMFGGGRRRRRRETDVIIVGAAPGRPVKRPTGPVQQFINFIIVLVLAILALLFYVQWRH